MPPEYFGRRQIRKWVKQEPPGGVYAFLFLETAVSTSGKFFSAQSHTDLKIGWRLLPSFVTEYSTRSGISG
jgi:hypothetical protein